MSVNLFGVFCLIALVMQSPVLAQEATTGTNSMQGGDAPADARDPNAQSGGYEYRHMSGWEETDEIVFSKIISDQLEYRNNDIGDAWRWDIQGWRGTDYKKLWVKFEGDDEVSVNAGSLELQTLYSRSVAPFWDLQIGGRFDRAYNSGVSNNRFLAVIGFQGLAPYWFELEPALFLSEDGDVSARITGTYDLLFSQRLVLQPRFEVNVAGSEVRDFGVGSGLNDVQLGLRLRYEIRREFAPYVGVSWKRQFGNTADLTRAEGGDVDNLAFLAGFRVWF
jgi:copper resistance protein B